MPAKPTLEALIGRMRERLAPVCHTSAQVSAEIDWLLTSVPGLTPAQRFAGTAPPLTDAQAARLEDLLARRVDCRVPLQYLLGEAHFYGLRLRVTPDVLIPRPETELLAEQAITACQETMNFAKTARCRMLDVGTGSGAIALAVKHALDKTVDMVAVDISQEALSVARDNARQLGLTIDFRQGDGLNGLFGETFDVIVSNPPYIGEMEKADMRSEVLNHEPHLALFPAFQQRDRLYFYRLLAERGQQFLTSGGTVLMEMGRDMHSEVSRLFTDHGYCTVQVLPDLGGQPRILSARR